MFIKAIKVLAVLAALTHLSQANAGLINQSAGNTTHGFSDGQILGFFPDVFSAQSGQAEPAFASVFGNEHIENFSTTWQFGYSAFSDNVNSASLTIGIWDHDSNVVGDQVGSFLLNGLEFSNALNSTFNARGGTDNEFNVYTLDLMALTSNSAQSVIDTLKSGFLDISLNLQGQAATTPFGGGAAQLTPFNGAGLIFANLSVSYSASTPNPDPIPEPAAFTLVVLGLVLLMRVKRNT